MSQQRTVSLPTDEEESEDPRVVEEEKKTTSAFFYEYISKRANKDQELKTSDAKIIEEQRQQAVQKVKDVSAVNVAAVLADLGKSFVRLGIFHLSLSLKEVGGRSELLHSTGLSSGLHAPWVLIKVIVPGYIHRHP